MEIYIITGYSGAGKTTTIKTLEDIGFYTVDNIPVDLIDDFIFLLRQKSNINKCALVLDLRSLNFQTDISSVIKKIKEKYPNIKVVFLKATKDTIINRYKESRRPHPLSLCYKNLSLPELIEKEIEILSPIEDIADIVIDTSGFNIHQLKEEIINIFTKGKYEPQINIFSFGFKYGIPEISDNIFDVRFLPNPHYVEKLRDKTGENKEVREYIFSKEVAKNFFNIIKNYIDFTLPNYLKEKKSYITYSFGCTGGKHRSVAFAYEIAKYIKEKFPNLKVFLEHRELGVRKEIELSLRN